MAFYGQQLPFGGAPAPYRGQTFFPVSSYGGGFAPYGGNPGFNSFGGGPSVVPLPPAMKRASVLAYDPKHTLNDNSYAGLPMFKRGRALVPENYSRRNSRIAATSTPPLLTGLPAPQSPLAASPASPMMSSPLMSRPVALSPVIQAAPIPTPMVAPLPTPIPAPIVAPQIIPTPIQAPLPAPPIAAPIPQMLPPSPIMSRSVVGNQATPLIAPTPMAAPLVRPMATPIMAPIAPVSTPMVAPISAPMQQGGSPMIVRKKKPWFRRMWHRNKFHHYDEAPAIPSTAAAPVAAPIA